jgi:hypothetical protein
VRIRVGKDHRGVVSVRAAADLLCRQEWPGPRDQEYDSAARVLSDALAGHCKPQVAARVFAAAARKAGILDTAEGFEIRSGPSPRPNLYSRATARGLAFQQPVRVTFRPSAMVEVRSVADASTCLLRHWPHDCGNAAYIAALRACLQARAGLINAAEARLAFIVAAVTCGHIGTAS